MIKDIIFRFLARGPRTLEELETETGIPRSLARSALLSEMYREVQVSTEFGTIHSWVPNPDARIRVDTKGVYVLIDN